MEGHHELLRIWNLEKNPEFFSHYVPVSSAAGVIIFKLHRGSWISEFEVLEILFSKGEIFILSVTN